MSKNVSQLNPHYEDEDQDQGQDYHEEAAELDAEEYREQLAAAVSDKDIVACFDALDDIEEERANLVEKKKAVIQALVDKGCHRQGIVNAWKRYSKPKKQQAKIDATFKVMCELVGGQGDLFGAAD